VCTRGCVRECTRGCTRGCVRGVPGGAPGGRASARLPLPEPLEPQGVPGVRVPTERRGRASEGLLPRQGWPKGSPREALQVSERVLDCAEKIGLRPQGLKLGLGLGLGHSGVSVWRAWVCRGLGLEGRVPPSRGATVLGTPLGVKQWAWAFPCLGTTASNSTAL